MRNIWVILPLAILSACTGRKASESVPERVDTAAVETTSVDTVTRTIRAAPAPSASSDGNSFTSADEAWNEGYYNGQQEGYKDAIHHLDYGYNYDDEPTYTGFVKAYVDGYVNGYEDGYNEGLEWNSENE